VTFGEPGQLHVTLSSLGVNESGTEKLHEPLPTGRFVDSSEIKHYKRSSQQTKRIHFDLSNTERRRTNTCEKKYQSCFPFFFVNIKKDFTQQKRKTKNHPQHQSDEIFEIQIIS
jgi:hypothetical protein